MLLCKFMFIYVSLYYIISVDIKQTMYIFLTNCSEFEASRTINKIKAISVRIFSPLLKGDIIVVDQGFRDAHVELLNNGYVVKAPHHQPAGIQLTTQQANESRLVTKVRNEVERANGRIKDFKLFDKIWLSLDIPNLKIDFTVAAALHNRFRFMQQQEDNNKSINLAREMLIRVPMKNVLAPIVVNVSFQNQLKKKMNCSQMRDFSIFPQLTLQDLEDLAFGKYQIYQAKLYLIQNLEENNNEFIVFRFNQNTLKSPSFAKFAHLNPELIMCELSSRFVSNTHWKPFVLFNPYSNGKSSILAYCCNCKVGNRTVGMCSHVMCIIFYLGYANNNQEVLKKAEHLKHIFDTQNTFD